MKEYYLKWSPESLYSKQRVELGYWDQFGSPHTLYVRSRETFCDSPFDRLRKMIELTPHDPLFNLSTVQILPDLDDNLLAQEIQIDLDWN